MEWAGFALLILVGVGIIATGLPAAFILITVGTFGAAAGVAAGTIPFSLLWALPGRLINLFDYDLLQALPLYVTMGLLLGRLPVADALFRTGNAILPKRASAPLVSGMFLGALLGPMNGSVGATRDAIVAVASTLGVLVPPSLVLILLADAMLSAHTYAVTATGRTDRVINTQDIFHAALLPAGIFLLLCVVLAWHAGRGQPLPPARERLAAKEAILAGTALVALLLLLGGVATGYFYAVEAAAVGAFVLLCSGIFTGRLHGPAMRALLHDAIAITGALFSLLIAATTFTLVLRLLGTDHLVNNLVAAIPGSDVLAVAVVLAVIGLCAFVLDAFEIIFVIIPIVIPPLLVRVADARWVAVMVLLTLQSSFLLPPFGYALMMVRGATKNPAPFRPFVRALVPFLLAQWLLLVVVLMVPKLVHFGEDAAENSRLPAAPMSNADIDKRMRDITPPPPPPPEFK
jgi:TRAP-type mannitol/chloroaromatic compound transport system permease large subunit